MTCLLQQRLQLHQLSLLLLLAFNFVSGQSEQAILGVDFDRLPVSRQVCPASSAISNGAAQHLMQCLGLCAADATCVAAHFRDVCRLMDSAGFQEAAKTGSGASACAGETWVVAVKPAATTAAMTTAAASTTSAVVAALEGAKYLGCYEDKASKRDLNQDDKDSDSMTRSYCLDFCRLKKQKYFGLQYRKECFCDNSYGQYGLRPETECNQACKGNSLEICGGDLRNSVYAILYAA